MKGLGLLLIFTSVSGLGFLAGFRCIHQIAQQKEMIHWITLLRGQIAACLLPLPEALEALGEKTGGEWKEFFCTMSRSCKEGIHGFQGIWEETLEKFKRSLDLSPEVYKEFMALGNRLGYLDKEMQLKVFDEFLEEQKMEYQEKSCQGKKKQRLYQALGMLAGGWLVILFI